MGSAKGFLLHDRKESGYRPVDERVADYAEVHGYLSLDDIRAQASRCLGCGVPFCHGPHGCPLGNRPPVFNEHMEEGRVAEAVAELHSTNNLPEITGRVCPAPCETACVLGINAPPVTIKQIECAIADLGWEHGLIRPQPAPVRTGKTVAVVGSGPAGLAAAQQLARAGHDVVVFERADRPGGLLAFGIPTFKLDRNALSRRIAQMEAEGVRFVTGAHVGVDTPVDDIRRGFDAIALCGGSTVSRELDIPGRTLGGIHRAMDYLVLQSRKVEGDSVQVDEMASAAGKDVVVIGGGDTGSDCIGTATRQGARSITQLEILPEPPVDRSEAQPWPHWPTILRHSSSHEEARAVAGGRRMWQVSTKAFLGVDGRVTGLRACRVDWVTEPGTRPRMVEAPGTEFELPAQLVVLAMGFLHPEHGGLLDQLGVALDERGNVRTEADRMTSVEGVFAAGDMRRGQSLVVWAIAEGRDVAYYVDEWLMGHSYLPRTADP